MSVDANALERETLERKDRDELQKIVGALGGKATSRTRKADLIDQILDLTGVTARTPAPAEPSSDPESGSEAPETVDPDADADDADAADAVPAETTPARADDSDGTGSSPRPASRPPADRPGGARPDGDRSESRPRPQPQPPRDGGGTPPSETSGNGDASADGDDAGDDGDQSKRRRRRGRNREAGPAPEEFSGEPVPVVGCLDLRDDGYGFLRVEGLLPSRHDCYVSVKQVRQFGLRKGDLIAGGSRPAFRNEKNPAILRIDTVNDVVLEPDTVRPQFEDFGATFPTEQIRLTLDDEPDNLTTRAVDLLAPIGKGSRVLVTGPPRSGKTTLLQTIARSIELNEPDVALIVVLIDERPEEITEMEGVVSAGTVYGTAFDAPPEDHLALTDLAMARARRMAEAGDDVVVVLDGLTRLARADHAGSHGVGRSLGGLDVAAIQAAKRAFGTGRDLIGAGSVTVVATAAVDTGSAADEAVLEAVIGAASAVIELDGFAAGRRAFPPLNVPGTGTRHEELLVGSDHAEARETLRRVLGELPGNLRGDQAVQLDELLVRLRATQTNDELLDSVAKDRASA